MKEVARAEWPNAMERVKREVFPTIQRMLNETKGMLRIKPLSHFGKTINNLCVEALLQSIKILKNDEIKNPATAYNEFFCSVFVEELVAMLNETLPTNYPYVITLFRIRGHSELQIAPVWRKYIPGFRDILRKDIKPYFEMESEKDIPKIQTGEIIIRLCETVPPAF